MKIENKISKNNIVEAIKACAENGDNLVQDTENMYPERPATVIALCILAQEEYAKAFLLHLVCENLIPWTKKVREALIKHKYKQLISLIMEWLNSSFEYLDNQKAQNLMRFEIPKHVGDAINVFVDKVIPKDGFSNTSISKDSIVDYIVTGNRDRIKQDALYVRLSRDGKLEHKPSFFTSKIAEKELEKARHVGELLWPLKHGSNISSINYDLLIESLNFLLTDKNNRPFLIIKDSKFATEPFVTQTGDIRQHTIIISIENISREMAKKVNGQGTLFIDGEIIKPFFTINKFELDSYCTAVCHFFITKEKYEFALNSSYKLMLLVKLNYSKENSDDKFQATLWSTYDPKSETFNEDYIDTSSTKDNITEQGREIRLHNPKSIC